MDLLFIVIVLVLIGFAVWFLTTRVPMHPYWALGIQVFVVIVLILWLLRSFGVRVPNFLS